MAESFVFGILGNIMAFLVYLAPVSTFYKIFKEKSTVGFQALPYSVTLFRAMMFIYYAILKQNSVMLIIVNSIGFLIETSYLVMHLIYAPPETRIRTTKLLVLFNAGAYVLIVLSTYPIPTPVRIQVVGWITAVFSVCVFAAPLTIMRQVIRTKSVKFMPFPLSFCLTINAVVWFVYGFLLRDFFIAVPNVVGFVLGIAQMILYLVYKDSSEHVVQQTAIEIAGAKEPKGGST